jgi:hypothetical protein
MDTAEYRAHPAKGSTDIGIAATKSVAHALVARARETTPAMRKGTLTHMATLEPEDMDELKQWEPGQCQAETAKGPQCKKAAVRGDDLCSLHGGVVNDDVISTVEYKELNDTATAIRNNISRLDEPFCHLLSGHQSEVPVFGELDDLEVKGLLDIWHPDVPAIADLKGTAMLPSVRTWGYRIRDGTGLVQAALYCHIARQLTGKQVSWAWLIHESAPPYGVVVYRAKEALIEHGLTLAREGVRRWKHYSETKDPWLGWPTKSEEMDVKTWDFEEE